MQSGTTARKKRERMLLCAARPALFEISTDQALSKTKTKTSKFRSGFLDHRFILHFALSPRGQPHKKAAVRSSPVPANSKQHFFCSGKRRKRPRKQKTRNPPPQRTQRNNQCAMHLSLGLSLGGGSPHLAGAGPLREKISSTSPSSSHSASIVTFTRCWQFSPSRMPGKSVEAAVAPWAILA